MRQPEDQPPPAPEIRSAEISTRFQGFQTLMPYRVREVLLVASRYDSFILEEEGQLSELILQEYERLNLRYAPRLTATPSGHRALELLGSRRRFDMVLLSMHPGSMAPAALAREVKQRFPWMPLVLLGYDNRELQELLDSPDADAFDRVFVWTGDARILPAIVSVVEDALNAEHDARTVGVETIIFIEDSVHFVSSVLPILYAKLMKQSQRLIGEGITLSHNVLRMRARPKILHADSYEDACDLFTAFRNNVLGVISDMRFPRNGVLDPEAGAAFAQHVRAERPDIPILLESTNPEMEARATELGAQFLRKDAPQLRQRIERFMLESFGFGPFVFRLPDGTRVTEANTLRELRRCLETVPDASLVYHSERRHFSTWLKARTEFRVAAALRPHHVSDYPSIAAMRRHLIESLDEFLRESHRDAIAEFDTDTFGSLSNFSRIGTGSLGGKARGLAFFNTLLREHGIGAGDGTAGAEGVEVSIPPTAVLATDFFDQFIEEHGFAGIVHEQPPDDEIRRRFLAASLPPRLVRKLRSVIRLMPYPVAVRSSSLLEDSQHQPFAGVYETYMVPNTHSNAKRRLADLCAAVKLVYASTFSEKARAYLEATPLRPEKEKMAVMIQKLIGRPHGGRFYPSISGIAQSYNYYPFGRVEPDDGTAVVALGLGHYVVEGRGGLRFCPRYPRHLPQLSTVEDTLRITQKKFDALRLDAEDASDDAHDAETHRRLQPARFDIDVAHADGMLDPIASVYDRDAHAIYDGTGRRGVPLITFAGVLKQRLLPLPELLCDLLDIAKHGTMTPVEIEFAVDLDPEPDAPATFACLQMRPLTVTRDLARIDLGAVDDAGVLCRSPRAMGHGRTEHIRDVVFIDPARFDRHQSLATADAVARVNAMLRAEDRPYLLIGPGRWGSADPNLGIPVNWGQIAGARIIVETALHDIFVNPSDGSHFFHNMTAFRVGYLTVEPTRDGGGSIDWPWLRNHEVVHREANGLCWVRLKTPLLGLIDGPSRAGLILKAAEFETAQRQRRASEGEPEVDH